MSITLLTENQMIAAEYYTSLLAKVKEILITNGSLLKAGNRTVNNRVYLGVDRSLPSLPAIHVEGLRHTEDYLAFGVRQNDIAFTVNIWIYNVWADSEENDQHIHQLGDRVLEVMRRNDGIDDLARQIIQMDAVYGNVATENTVLRTGLITLRILKHIDAY
jgi:hypothetical protein